MKANSYRIFLILALSIGTLFFTNTPASATETTNVTNNTITAEGDLIGAFAGVGDNNTAVGVAGVIGNNIIIGELIPLDEQMNGHVGTNSQAEEGWNNRAIGAGAAAGWGNNNTALGSGSTATHTDGSTAVGSNAWAQAGNSVALGANSVADRPNTVSVGNSSGYGPQFDRQITNVAPGYYGTDAVNMSQLWTLDSKVNRVGAMAFAMSALAPLPYDPKDPTQYSAGIGTYNGQSAVALGIYHYTKPTVMLNAAVAMSDDRWEKSARMGITWRTGGPKPKALIPASAVNAEPVSAPDEGIMSRINKIIAAD